MFKTRLKALECEVFHHVSNLATGDEAQPQSPALLRFGLQSAYSGVNKI